MKRKRLLTILIIVTLTFIWVQSLLPRSASAAESGALLRLLAPLIRLLTGAFPQSDHLLRKAAHFIEFFALGAEFGCYFLPAGQASGKERLRAFGKALCHAGFAALTDETLQLFSQRGAMIADVWLDILGASAGAGICLLAAAAARRCR